MTTAYSAAKSEAQRRLTRTDGSSGTDTFNAGWYERWDRGDAEGATAHTVNDGHGGGGAIIGPTDL